MRILWEDRLRVPKKLGGPILDGGIYDRDFKRDQTKNRIF